MGAGLQLKIDVNDREVRVALQRLANKVFGLRPALDSIGNHLLTSTRERMTAEHDPQGNPWKPLTSRYVNRPKKQGGRGGDSHPILFRTGRHIRSRLTYKATDRAVAIGSNAKFPGGDASALAIHQLGGKPGMAPGPAAIPARPFLGVDHADEREILRIVRVHLGEL